MDPIDRELLELLQDDCRLSYAELGKRVGLSISAVNERVKKLHTRHIVDRYVALVDAGALGYHVKAFVQVLIDTPENEAQFIEAMRNVPQVTECHCVTGEYGYILKVLAMTPSHLEDILKNSIKPSPGVVRTHSLIALSTHKETTALPVAAGNGSGEET